MGPTVLSTPDLAASGEKIEAVRHPSGKYSLHERGISWGESKLSGLGVDPYTSSKRGGCIMRGWGLPWLGLGNLGEEVSKGGFDRRPSLDTDRIITEGGVRKSSARKVLDGRHSGVSTALIGSVRQASASLRTEGDRGESGFVVEFELESELVFVFAFVLEFVCILVFGSE